MRSHRVVRFILFLWIFQIVTVSVSVAQGDLVEQLKFEANNNRTPIKCGFPVFLEAAASQDASVKALLKQRRWQNIQQLTQTYPSPSGHFLIHYDTSGTNAIPTYDRNQNDTPDYLEFVAKSFDRAWDVEIDSLGFHPPPDSTGAPHTVYPVFCKYLGNLYGSTTPDIALGGDRYTTFLEINTDFSFITYPDITTDPIIRDSLAIAVTAAHEFNHALQSGYRLWWTGGRYIDLWFIESSATYMEEVVAQEVNDYLNYLDCIFSSTDIHLTQNNFCDRIYGEAILFIMLGELEAYGKEITRDIWSEIVNQPALQSLSIILEQKGSSLNKEMQRWATWMFFSGDYAIPGEFYPEADQYPNPEVIELDPVLLTQKPNEQVYENQLPSLSFELFRIPVVATDEILILIDPLQHSNSWYGSQLNFIEPYQTQFGAGIPYPANFTPPSQDIYLAVTSGDWDMGNTAPKTVFTIDLQATGDILGEDILVGPNPVKAGDANAVVNFLNLPEETVIEIFSSNGMRVARVNSQEAVPVAQWDLRNERNNLVGSGVYIYHIASPNKSVSGKILVIR